MSNFWKGTSEEVIELLKNKDYEALKKLIKDNDDLLTIKGVSSLGTKELDCILQYGTMVSEEIFDAIEDSDELVAVFELGRLFGSVQTTSHYQYEAVKNRRVEETAKEFGMVAPIVRKIVKVLATDVTRMSKKKLVEEIGGKNINNNQRNLIDMALHKLLSENFIYIHQFPEESYTLTDEGHRYYMLIK